MGWANQRAVSCPVAPSINTPRDLSDHWPVSLSRDPQLLKVTINLSLIKDTPAAHYLPTSRPADPNTDPYIDPYIDQWSEWRSLGLCPSADGQIRPIVSCLWVFSSHQGSWDMMGHLPIFPLCAPLWHHVRRHNCWRHFCHRWRHHISCGVIKHAQCETRFVTDFIELMCLATTSCCIFGNTVEHIGCIYVIYWEILVVWAASIVLRFVVRTKMSIWRNYADHCDFICKL